MNMKLRKFLEQDDCLFVVRSLTDDRIIRFSGPRYLTEKEEREFAPILDNKVSVVYCSYAVVQIEDEEQDALVFRLFTGENLDELKSFDFGKCPFCGVELHMDSFYFLGYPPESDIWGSCEQCGYRVHFRKARGSVYRIMEKSDVS